MLRRSKEVNFNNRVAIIEPSGSYSGMHYYNFGMCFGLLSSNIKPYLFTDSNSILLNELNLNVFNYFKATWTQKMKIFKIYFYFLGLIKSVFISKRKYCNIVHLHQFHVNYQLLITVLFCRLFFKKIVLTLHDLESFDGDNVYLKDIFGIILVSTVDNFIVHNNFCFNALSNKMKLKSTIIRHGNYIPFFKTIGNKRVNSRFELLFFGLIKESKGLDVLLESLVILKESGIDFHLTIAGRPWRNDFSEFQQFIDRNDLAAHISSHLFFISEIDLLEFFDNCDLVVLPYKKIFQSGVILKSMSLKRAVLCSNLPAFEELVVDGTNGFVFRSEDPISLAHKLKDIILRREHLEEITEMAYTNLEKDYGWEKIGLELRNTYYRIYEK